MNMFRIILSVLTVLCFSSFTLAETSNHRQAAEKVLLLMKTDEITLSIMRNNQQTELRKFQQLNLPSGAMDIVEKYFDQMTGVIFREFEWKKIKDDYIDIYTNTYKEEELNELINFYTSPLGIKMIEKTPVLTQQAMQISQNIIKTTTPEIQDIAKEMMNELKQKYPKLRK